MKRIQQERYDLVYDTTEAGVIYLKSYELHDGYSLFRVSASYAKTVPACSYYVVERTKAEATRRFKESFPWLNLIVDVAECSDIEKSNLLGEYYRAGKAVI